MRNYLLLLAASTAVACSNATPVISAVSPKTLCANVTATLTITGTDLDPGTVEIGDVSPDGGAATAVKATMVTGSGTTVVATFDANTLTPRDLPYDVTFTHKNGNKVTFPDAVTVVPGISLAAVDPGAAYAGVDFPVSVFGTGMGGVVQITIGLNGQTTNLTGVTPVDPNRVDAVVPKGLAAGAYDVTVVDQDGCIASLPAALTVVTDVTVAACSIDPTFGWTMEDTDVTISGGSCKPDKFVSTPRAWLNVGGALKALKNVAFVNDASLTATVPAGITVGGPYDVIVQNPDGKVGVLSAAFKVVDQPVPSITSIDPPTIRSNQAVTLKIFGKNFRAPVKVEVYGQTVALKEVPSPTVVSPTEVDVAFDNQVLQLAPGAYIVRVTDTDQGTFGEFSVLAIVSASGNIGSWTDVTTAPMPNPTMRHGAAGGQVSSAARYLYVVGGDAGGNTPTRYDLSQIASIDKFGNVGGWFIGHNKLPAARTSLQLLEVPAASGQGGYLYAIGGNTAAATVNTVSRARILLPSEAPKVMTSTVSLGGTLPRGTFYYRVSAILDGTDLTNPNGETLPSEEVAAHTVDTGKVTLAWGPVDKAAKYRVYRTAMVNGTSKDEVLLADNLTATTFVDDGSATAGTARPLAQGEHGVWVDVQALKAPRRSHAAALAHDSKGALYAYVLGGDKATDFTVTTAAADIYDDYEYAPITDDGMTLGAWTQAASTFGKRTRLAASVGEHATSPSVPINTAFVYAVGGYNGTTTVESYQPGTVADGGALTWGTAEVVTGKILQSLAAYIVSDWLFVLGGELAAGTPQKAAFSNAYLSANTQPPVFGTTLNANSAAATDTGGTESIAAATPIVFLSSTFYLVGGTLDGTAAITRVWKNTY